MKLRIVKSMVQEVEVYDGSSMEDIMAASEEAVGTNEGWSETLVTVSDEAGTELTSWTIPEII